MVEFTHQQQKMKNESYLHPRRSCLPFYTGGGSVGLLQSNVVGMPGHKTNQPRMIASGV
jgi:hypothetical protein